MVKNGNRWVMSVVNTLLGVAGFVNIAFGTWFCIKGQVSGGGIIAAGLVLVLVATVDRFEVIKGLGLEAKTRAVDRKLDEVENVLAKLRTLTALFGSAVIRTASQSGRWDTGSQQRDIHRFVESTRGLLSELGATDEGLRDGLDAWARTVATDLVFRITNPLRVVKGDKFQALQAAYQAAYLDEVHKRDPDGRPVQAVIDRQTLLANAHTYIEERWKWPLEEWVPRLREALSEFPELEPEERAAVVADFDKWAPELDHLIEHREIKSPEKVLALLESHVA